MLARLRIARDPTVVRPIVASAAELELTLHAIELGIGDSLDHVLQIAVGLLVDSGRGDEKVGHLRTPVRLRRCA